RQSAVAIPVREAEHPLSHRQPPRAIAEGGDHSGQLVPRDRRCSVTVEAIGPGRGPRQLSRDESRRMNLNDDIVYRCLGLGPLHQRHPGGTRRLVRHNDRLHDNFLLDHLSLGSVAPSRIGAPALVHKKAPRTHKNRIPRGMSEPLRLELDRSAKTPLSEQIRKGVRAAIESGVLAPGARLPSWQDLAAQLGVARGTVRSAYEKLS